MTFPDAPSECGGNDPRTLVFDEMPTLESLQYRDEAECEGSVETDFETCAFSWVRVCSLVLEPGMTTRTGSATYNGFAFVGQEQISYSAPSDSCERTSDLRMTRWERP